MSLSGFLKTNFLGLLFSAAATIGNLSASEKESYLKSEITGGVDSTVGFVRVNLITDHSVQYSFTGSYSYSLTRHIQVGFQANVSDLGTQIDSFHYGTYIPFTYNWGGNDLREDYFVRLSPGITYDYAVNTALLLQFGKRFKILENLSWRPTLGLTGRFGNGAARSAIDFVPVAFSILF